MNESPTVRGGVGRPLAHESAHLHVSGRAPYCDDIPEVRGTLYAAIGLSERACARLRSIDLTEVLTAPGVVAAITAADIPGKNNVGPVIADDPIFAQDQVQCVGQSLFAVAATSLMQARRAVRRAKVVYEELPSVLTAEAALEAHAFVLPTQTLRRGDPQRAIARAPHRLTGRLTIGGQEHFSLEGHIAYALPREDGTMLVYSSTQHPGEVQMQVAHALGLTAKDVVVECRRMGGAFGGKETQPALFACVAALLARRCNAPVKVRPDRDDDMSMTGKRHDFVTDYDVGFDDEGRIAAVLFTLTSRCGYSVDLSGAINDRAIFHSDNCYFLEHVEIVSHRCRTNTVSNTAFRGFGGPQGMLGIEQIIDEIARALGRDPLAVRKANLYGISDRNVTPYGQTIEDNVIHDVIAKLEKSSDYHQRRAEIRAFNAVNPILKRGIALTPVKFGISFTATHLNQAGALLLVYTDGTVLLNHGGTEMGQGLFTKVAQVVAHELQIDVERVRVTASDTSKVPNASATAASASSDLNGKAAQDAARTIKNRLIDFAVAHFGIEAQQVRFERNEVHVGSEVFSFAEFVHRAHAGRVSLAATGFYRTPKIAYDRGTLSGRPFYYFAYGAAVSEVVIDTLTGENRLLRVDILHDVGRSLNPAIDTGQIEGGFVQGMGWLTTEELCWDAQGQLTTHAPSTYKIPVASDVPADFRVAIYDAGWNAEDAIFRSKAVGEPPLMLAISVFHAIRDAVASTGGDELAPRLNAPATPQEILRSIVDLRVRLGAPADPAQAMEARAS
ncbi:MAG TPA: xanthine dehydrogenase molybdopterin binding subunit [Candidatus Acidoferrales bacterium]|nr:xanthine dehydrogenase molybdopterin binding subunit [Candidatus Acidoferrales bacterium]